MTTHCKLHKRRNKRSLTVCIGCTFYLFEYEKGEMDWAQGNPQLCSSLNFAMVWSFMLLYTGFPLTSIVTRTIAVRLTRKWRQTLFSWPYWKIYSNKKASFARSQECKVEYPLFHLPPPRLHFHHNAPHPTFAIYWFVLCFKKWKGEQISPTQPVAWSDGEVFCK